MTDQCFNHPPGHRFTDPVLKKVYNKTVKILTRGLPSPLPYINSDDDDDDDDDDDWL